MIPCISSRLFINFLFWKFFRRIGSCRTLEQRGIVYPVSPDSYISCKWHNALQPKTCQEHTSSHASWVYYLLRWWGTHAAGNRKASQSDCGREKLLWDLGFDWMTWGTSKGSGVHSRLAALRKQGRVWGGVSQILSLRRGSSTEKKLSWVKKQQTLVFTRVEGCLVFWVARRPGFWRLLRQNDQVALFCLIFSW